jgi:hypothetical protein
MEEMDRARVHSKETLVQAEGVKKAIKKHIVRSEQAGMNNRRQSEIRGIEQPPMVEEDLGRVERAEAANKINKKAASNKAPMNTKGQATMEEAGMGTDEKSRNQQRAVNEQEGYHDGSQERVHAFRDGQGSGHKISRKTRSKK